MRLVTRLVFALVLGAAVALLGAAHAAGASGGPLRPPSPFLIERAIESGKLDASTAGLYYAYALFAPERLPEAYRSPTPFHGTLPLLKAREALAEMPSSAQRTELESLLGAEPFPSTPLQRATDVNPGTSICQLSPLPTINRLETAHFIIEYNEAEVNNSPDGLTI